MPAVLSSRITFSVSNANESNTDLYTLKQEQSLKHYSDEYYTLVGAFLYRTTLKEDKGEMRIEFIDLGVQVNELQFDTEDIRNVIDWETLEDDNVNHARARAVISSSLLDLLILGR
jgi:hypothetical protein